MINVMHVHTLLICLLSVITVKDSVLWKEGGGGEVLLLILSCPLGYF